MLCYTVVCYLTTREKQSKKELKKSVAFKKHSCYNKGIAREKQSKKNFKKVLTRYKPHDILKLQRNT